jgi:hypothetical protein
MRFIPGFRLLLLCLSGIASLQGQEYMPPTNNPPAADYEPQGEYVGTIQGGAKLGAWVVARGSSTFDVVLLPGGLLDLTKAFTGHADPNGGWDGHTRFSASNITLSGTTFTATLTGGGTTYQLTSITGSGAARVLNGTAGGSPFALVRKTGVNGLGGERQGPTLGLRPEGKLWSTGYQSWFVDGNKATTAEATADLSKWKSRDSPSGLQLKYGNFLFRGVQSVATHGSCFLHIEVRSPFMPTSTGQNRGNSGIFLRGMHEQQVLDSFGSSGAQDELGAVYKVKPPLVNAALPPLTWQVYDIYYMAGTGTNGTFTTYLNGVLVQDATPVTVVTEAGFNGTSLYLQYHGNEVIYNNIWLIPNATPAVLPYSVPSSGLNCMIACPLRRSDRVRLGGINSIRASGTDPVFDATGRAIRDDAGTFPSWIFMNRLNGH